MKKNIFVILVFIITIIGISFYSDGNKDDITKTINYNGNNLRISIDGEITSTLPTNGTYYLVDYDCKSSSTKLEWDKTNYKLNISNGTKKGDVVCNLEFKSKPLLSEMPVGSYVKYTGTNGCNGIHCEGDNANYVSDTDMGYCNSSNYKFHVNGWRIGYIEDGSTHLVSAGSTDCMCSDSSGNPSSSSCSNYLSSTNLFKHFENMNNIVLKYCNKDYAKDGVCITNNDENETVWAMNADDFKKITGSTLSSGSCYNKYSNVPCGYNNDLIDNGGYYWVATPYDTSSYNTFSWYPNFRGMRYNGSNGVIGVRPVLALESSIIVVGGDGTYESPYLIDNNYFNVNSENVSATTLSLHSIDENVSMCVSVDTSVCTNYIDYSDTYSLDLSTYSTGEHIIYVYYRNSDEQVVASMNKSVIIKDEISFYIESIEFTTTSGTTWASFIDSNMNNDGYFEVTGTEYYLYYSLGVSVSLNEGGTYVDDVYYFWDEEGSDVASSDEIIDGMHYYVKN